MSFFEDAVIEARAVTNTVTEKAGKLVDVSRLRLSAAELTRDISRRYEAMGRAIYDAQKSGEDLADIISECTVGIDALYTRLDDVNMKIAQLKNRKYCAACGALVDEKALFCQRCGSRIDKEKSSGSADISEK